MPRKAAYRLPYRPSAVPKKPPPREAAYRPVGSLPTSEDELPGPKRSLPRTETRTARPQGELPAQQATFIPPTSSQAIPTCSIQPAAASHMELNDLQMLT